MKPYEIEAATGGLSVTYTVHPKEDGRFLIMNGNEQLGFIYPEVLENSISWHSRDDIDDLLLRSLGSAIEAQEKM